MFSASTVQTVQWSSELELRSKIMAIGWLIRPVEHLRGDEAFRTWRERVIEKTDFGGKPLSSIALVTNPELRGQMRILKIVVPKISETFLSYFSICVIINYRVPTSYLTGLCGLR
jgi:hypothetical protein